MSQGPEILSSDINARLVSPKLRCLPSAISALAFDSAFQLKQEMLTVSSPGFAL